MSETPYLFYQIPPEFFTDEFLEDPIMMKFIRYIFKRIRPSSHTELVRNNRMLIQLDLGPREFMFGREKAALECGCSEKQIRNRIETLRASSYLQEIPVINTSKGHFSTVRASSSDQKGASSSDPKRASTFTVYRLVTESLSQIKGQQFSDKKGQQKGQQFGKKKGHKEEGLLEFRFKEDHHPDPSSSKVVLLDADLDGLTDDIFLEEGNSSSKEASKQHNINYHDAANNQKLKDKEDENNLIEIYQKIFITQETLDKCYFELKAKSIPATLENVKFAAKYVMESEDRNSTIKNWPNVIKTWNIPYPTFKNHLIENERYAKQVEALNSTGYGWLCEICDDSKKDQKILHFYSTGQGTKTISIGFSDTNFRKRVDEILTEKNMKMPKQKNQGVA